MKKLKRIGIIAISSLLAFSITGCDIFNGIFDISGNTSESQSAKENSSEEDESSSSNSSSSSDNQRQPRIYFNDSSMTQDDQGRYCLSRNGGQSYTFRASYSNAPQGSTIRYSLATPNDLAFCSITSDGSLTTKDDFYGSRTVTINVEMVNPSGSVIATATIVVTIVNQDEPPAPSEFKVFNNETGLEVAAGSDLSLYVGTTLSFSMTLDNVATTGSITIDIQYATVNGNAITAIKDGSPIITFSAKDSWNIDYFLTARLVINKNVLSSIYAPNSGNDFFVLNDELIFNGSLKARYANGTEVAIAKDDANLSYRIGEVTNEAYKNVTFTYEADSVTKTVTYPVLFSNPTALTKKELGFNYKDYGLSMSGVGYGKNFVNSTGNINALVIPVWFNNSSQFFTEAQKEQLLEDVNTVTFSQNDDTVYCSMKEYFAQASHGKLNIDGYVTGFYESSRNTTAFSDESSNTIYDFGKEAIPWYTENYSSRPISNYDADGNGKVDVAIFLFAGNYYGSGSNTHSYAFNVVFNKNTSGAGVHPYLDSCIFMPIGAFYGYEFKTANQTGQKNIADLSARNANAFLNAGDTLIHEMGHSLGCVDLYTQNGHSKLYQTGGYEPTGNTTIMNSAFEGMDPFESNVLEWTEPYVLKANDYETGQSFDVQIDDFQTSGDNIILSPSWNAKDSPFDEYMQLELYSPNGLNAYSENLVDEVGIKLWHINAALEKDNNGKTGYFPGDGSISMIANNHYETEEDFDIVHLIRNDTQEEYKSSKYFSGEDLFKSGDSFVFEDYQSQFKKGPMFDNRDRLGWSFSVKSIFQKQDGSYSCVLTVTRVDKTIINFYAESNLHQEFTQPEESGIDYASDIFGSGDDLSLIYNYNDAAVPTSSFVYEQGKPISWKGICLFSATSGNGGSLVITVKNKAGKQVLVKKVTITYNIITNAASTLTGLVNGEAVTPTKFDGPESEYCDYDDKGLIYEVNAQSFTLQNKYTGEVNHYSLIAITSIAVDYSII